jgi:putative membrane protein
MLRFMASASLIALALAMPATAQTGNPAFTPSGTPSAQPGVPAPHRLNTTDRVVIEQLAIGNAAEIELAKVAGQKAQSQAVKDFAQAMLQDHDAAGKRVADFAKASGVPLPSGLDAEHQALHQHLAGQNGAGCVVAFGQAQVADHQKTLHLLEHEIGSGQDAELRAFAAESLPMIREHLRMAQRLALGATPYVPQAAAAPPSPTAPSATAPPVGGPTSRPAAAPQTPPAQPR